MTNQRITARQFEALKAPPGGRAHLTDTEVRGLTLRATPKAKTWSYLTRINGTEKVRLTIGAYGDRGPERGEFSVSEARDEARRLREMIRQGHDPRQDRRQAKQQAKALTVADAIDLYARIYLAPNLRTARERDGQLRNALAANADRPVADLTSADLQRAIDEKAADGKLGAANRIRAALIHFAKWCWQRGHIAEHIGAATTRAAREHPRDRVLSIDEVREIWHATDLLGEFWGPFLRLLILTAQRRGDVAGARWSEMDLDARRWSIGAERTKNRKPHIVHLSTPALAELEALRERADGDLILTSTGTSPISGFAKMKARVDRLVDVEDWRLHDLRTAFASALCEAGESEAIVDRILNHSASGSAPSAVARVYNRATNLPQRAAALDRWAEMVTGERGVVVNMAARDG